MAKREKANYLIQSVAHGLDVLEELAKAAGETGVTELSKRLKLHKNNVFRLLATLELRGYVEQNKDSEDYRLGVKALELGQSYLAQSSLVARGTSVLKKLSEATGETASLVVLRSGQVQFPLSIESKRPVKVAPRIAVSFQAKQNTAGRLLLAQLPDSVLSEILAANSPQDAAIKNQLSEMRKTGQLIDRGVIEPEVISMTRIVKGYGNEVVGAIEVLSPQYRAKVESILPQLEEAAQSLSAALGAGKAAPLTGAIEKEISISTSEPLRTKTP